MVRPVERQLPLKRAIYEWCGLGFATLAMACIPLWVLSRAITIPSVELSFGYSMQMSAAGGNITFCDHINNLEVIDIVSNSAVFDPAPTAIHSGRMPGLQFDYLRKPKGLSQNVRMSLSK